jgi:tetratricopeptide (TPR) repeat protein
MKFVFFPVNLKAAYRYYKEKKIPQAKKIIQKLLEKIPGNPEVHFLHAKCFLLEKNKEMALVEFREVNKIGLFSELFPEIEFREDFANLLYSMGHNEEALQQYVLLTKKKPGNPEYLFRAAKLFEEKKNLRKAVELYNKTIQVDSGYEDAFIRLGMIYYSLKKRIEAEKIFTKAYSLNQFNSSASFWLGIIARDNENYKKAITYMEPALRNPDYKVQALLERGKCMHKLGNYYGAQPELERAVRLTKGGKIEYYLDGLYYLALNHEKNKEIEQAIEYWKAIYNLNPHYLDVASKLQQFHQLRNDDRIKDYITASKSTFYSLCKRLIEHFGMKHEGCNDLPGGCEITAVEKKSGSILPTSKQSVLVWFLRISESITESTVRSFLDRMKAGSFQKGILCSSSTFTNSACQFASSRAIDLITPSQLQKMLSSST